MSDSTPATTFEHSEKLSDGQSQVTSTKSHWDGKTRVTRDQDDAADIPQAEDSSSDDDTDDDDNGIDKDGKAVVQENQTTIVHGEKLVADEGPLGYCTLIISIRLTVSDLLEEEDPEAEDITIVQAKIHSMSALQLGRFGKLKVRQISASYTLRFLTSFRGYVCGKISSRTSLLPKTSQKHWKT